MDFCERYGKVAWARPSQDERKLDAPGIDISHHRISSHFGKLVLFTRLRCGQWNCDFCSQKNQSIWRAFLHDRLPEVEKDWHLLTLTAHSKKRSLSGSYENLQSGIDIFMKRIRRCHGKIEYVRTFERHPMSDALHAHFIISGLSAFCVPGTWGNFCPCFLAVTERTARNGFWSLETYLKSVAFECGMGYMADAAYIPVHAAANYVTKYLTKDLQGIDIKGLRHVQTTRGIGSPAHKSDLSWQVADFVTARDFLPGEHILDLQTGEQVPQSYWEEFDCYPPELN